MATYSSIFIPVPSGAASTSDISASLATVTASAEIVMAKNAVFAINATGDLNIIFGMSGVKTPTASNFRIPSGATAFYDLGDGADRIRLFNATGSTVTYYIQFLTRT